MRILFLSNYYPPFEVGGYEQLCRDVAERMEERGHAVAVLTSDHGLVMGATDDENCIYRQLQLRPQHGHFPGPGFEFFTSRGANSRHNISRLGCAINDFDPDVVFIWNLQGLPRELVLECERRTDLAVAYWLAGYTPAEPDEFWSYWQYEPTRWLARVVKRPLRRLAQGIMLAEGKPIRPKMAHTAVVSHYMRDRGIADGTLPTSTQVIYNGVELEAFYQPVKPRGSGPLRVLTAGRVSSDKGVHTTVEAVSLLSQAGKGSRVLLDIVGRGPAEYEGRLRRMVAANNISDNVRLLGYRPREEMPDIMSRYDVLILPSIYPEAFSRVVLEAMAASLAVVGTTVGGTGEVLQHEVTGLAFRAEDGRDLAGQLERLIEDEELLQRLAISGQRQVQQRFSMATMVERLEEFLAEALQDA